VSRLGKTLLLIAGFCILVFAAVRTVLGGWHDSLFIPMGIGFLCMLGNFIKDISFYKEFFTMRTTKHGMNMGLLILLSIIFLFALNFMAIRHNVKWDLTEEGLNSLSDQTVKILTPIKDEVKIRFFYRGGSEGVAQVRERFREMVGLYKDENNHVKTEFIDSIKRPGLAKEYGVNQPGATVFLDYKGKRNRVDPLSEEGLTTALVKATRDKNKKVYVLIGHGEMDIENSGVDGASEFKKALQDSGYDVEILNLLDKGAVPKGAELLAILGPTTAFLAAELKAMSDYTREGGRFFIAADPGTRNNVARLTKTLGIEFNNDYVLDQFGQIIGASAAMALGREYGMTDITKGFRSGMMTTFHLATSLKKADDTNFTVEEVVKTGGTSFTSDQISNGRMEVNSNRRGPHIIAMTSTGKLSAVDKSKDSNNSKIKEFSAVVIGDSDFLGNQFLFQQLNRDLALNSIAYLLKETNLISIRPKQPIGTTLTLSRNQFWGYIFGVILPIPILLFGLGGFSWYRRRNA